MESELSIVESLIRSKDVPVYPFKTQGEETSNMDDESYREMVRKGIKSCYRGDVFQVVLSRRFQRPFIGDEFNVYRALRSINPSPYLFFFDYGDYRLMGSSPESQLIVQGSTRRSSIRSRAPSAGQETTPSTGKRRSACSATRRRTRNTSCWWTSPGTT